MAPEILIKGHISKAADVYALGMVLWELYTGQKVFKGIPRALLGHHITQLHRCVAADGVSPLCFVYAACNFV
jgi:serine/threonine protein kinase